jgi:hypothetical protein
MCFLSVPAVDESDGWLFTVPNGAPLKLHENVYSAAEATDTAQQAAHLQGKSFEVQFRAEHFDSRIKPGSDFENDSAGFEHFRKLVGSLVAYSPAPFQRFYWTTDGTQQFYREHAEQPGLGRDVVRSEKWGELASTWQLFEDDVCNYSVLRGQVELQPVRSMFSLAL